MMHEMIERSRCSASDREDGTESRKEKIHGSIASHWSVAEGFKLKPRAFDSRAINLVLVEQQ